MPWYYLKLTGDYAPNDKTLMYKTSIRQENVSDRRLIDVIRGSSLFETVWLPY